MQIDNTRIEAIDIAKGLGLITVVFGHLFTYGGKISTIIFSFHMPLFFFLSGYFFNPNKETNFEKYAIKKFKSLILPYIVFCFIGFLFSVAIPSWRVGLSWHTLVEVFYLTSPESLHIGQIWFLVCLFWVEILAFIIYKYIFSKIKLKLLIIFSLLAIAILGYYVSMILPYFFVYQRAPFKMDSALTAIVFYFLGYYTKKCKLIKYLIKWKYLIAPICIIMDIIISIKYLGWANISALIYNNFILYYFCALLGIFAVISVGLILESCCCFSFSYLGKRTLILFSLHSFLIYLTTYILSQILGYAVLNGANVPIQYCIIGGGLIILCFFPICYCYDKCRKSRLLTIFISSLFDNRKGPKLPL